MLIVTLELQVFHNTAAKDQAIIQAVRLAAKQLLTQATLIQDKHAPRIRIEAGDYGVSTNVEIELIDEQGNELEVAESAEQQVVVREKRGLERLNINAKKRDEDDE